MKANIVIMGQSGNGKSTIVNAIMGKEVAPTGKGTTVITKNQVYTTSYIVDSNRYTLNLYDTVGIELSDKVTQATLSDIEDHLKKSQMQSSTFDVNLVWFCINNRSSRFQDFEVDLIRKLSLEYEIPFIIVMTQCLDNQIGELERSIRSDIPEVMTTRILAKDYTLRDGMIIPAYGLDDLIKLSLSEYNKMKVRVLETKLDEIQQKLEVSEWYIKSYEDKAKACAEDYVNKAGKIGWFPGGCIPFVHGLCINMVVELHKIYGLSSSEEFAANIFAHIVVGLLATPLMVVPVLSSVIAEGYVSVAGDQYIEALSNAIRHSKYSDLGNQKLMAEKIKQQLNLRIRKVSIMDENDIFNTANIIIAGVTGAGKSTLINAVFGKDFAVTGKGRPVTQEIKEYRNPSVPVRIWDSIGFEIGDDNSGVSKTKASIKKIKKTIEEQVSKNQVDQIHAIWYCINQGGSRYQPTEAEFVKELHSFGVPFIIVITQCIEEDNEFKKEIYKLNYENGISDIPVIEVLAQDKTFRGGASISAFGLMELVDTTLKMLPDFIKKSFIAGQQIKIVLKREECENIITKYEKMAIDGFWDKVPLINLGVVNSRFKNMVKEIFAVYNQILPEDAYDKCVADVYNSLKKNQIRWVFTPDLFNKKNKQKLEKLFNDIREKGAEGLELKERDFEESTKTARTIVFYGYTLLMAIEDVWKMIRDKKIENLEEKIIPAIRKRIEHYLNNDQDNDQDNDEEFFYI